jgi:hypothetical protein
MRVYPAAQRSLLARPSAAQAYELAVQVCRSAMVAATAYRLAAEAFPSVVAYSSAAQAYQMAVAVVYPSAAQTYSLAAQEYRTAVAAVAYPSAVPSSAKLPPSKWVVGVAA